jgi:hypothetical protein
MKLIGHAFKILFMLLAGRDQTDVYETVTGDKPVGDRIPTAGEIFGR